LKLILPLEVVGRSVAAEALFAFPSSDEDGAPAPLPPPSKSSACQFRPVWEPDGDYGKVMPTEE